MNKFEKALIEASKTAHKDYEDSTGGWWLSHGPESFMQYTIAIKLKEQGFWVYPEASPEKIMKERNDPPKGRPPKKLDQSFDLVVCEKAADKIRAVIEIKQVWNKVILRDVQKKMATFIKLNDYVKSGYLLLYTEVKGAGRQDTLSNRLKEWANDLKCELVGSVTDAQGDGEWGWTTGLYRLL